MKSRPVYLLKVGGSLLDLPDLGLRLRTLRAQLGSAALLFFPGGGAAADVVRELDRVHRLGEEASHWLALRSLSLNAHVLGRVLGVEVIEDPLGWRTGGGVAAVVDPLPWTMADEREAGHCSHGWEVTSDSLAVRLAQVLEVDVLFLLKSAPLPAGTSWSEAARLGLVDGFFPMLCERGGVSIQWVNLRDDDARA